MVAQVTRTLSNRPTEDPGVVEQVSTSTSPRFLGQPELPFKSAGRCPRRGFPEAARHNVKCLANTDHDGPRQVPAMVLHPELLLRRTECHENDVGTRLT